MQLSVVHCTNYFKLILKCKGTWESEEDTARAFHWGKGEQYDLRADYSVWSKMLNILPSEYKLTFGANTNIDKQICTCYKGYLNSTS